MLQYTTWDIIVIVILVSVIFGAGRFLKFIGSLRNFLSQSRGQNKTPKQRD
jgi:Sec-independent protein translocase protein TatA